jgi:hypothetical protein
MLSGAPVRIKLRTRIPLKFHCNRRPLESCRRQTTYQNGPRRSGAPMSGLCSIQRKGKAQEPRPSPHVSTGTSLFAPPRQRAATRGQPHTTPPRSESFEKSSTTRASSTPRSPSARPRRPQSAIARRRRRSSKRVLHDNRIVGALIKQLPLVNYVHTTSTDS